MTDKRQDYDVIIIGGGPAGMSATLWCSDLGLSCALLEKQHELGGQLNHIYNQITNYPGVKADDGREMSERFSASLRGAGFHFQMPANVTTIDADAMTVGLADGDVLSAQAIFLATGIRRRKLGVPGETEYRGKGILESGAKEANAASNRHVAIVGGGDAALENALVLSENASKVTVIHRRAEFSARGHFVAEARVRDNITMLMETKVTGIGGDGRVEWIDVRDSAGGERRLKVENILIRIGVVPNTELVRGVAELDEQGYCRVDDLCRTGRPGLYAIGDVACPVSPTISTAAGMGATAAKAVFAWLNGRERL